MPQNKVLFKFSLSEVFIMVKKKFQSLRLGKEIEEGKYLFD